MGISDTITAAIQAATARYKGISANYLTRTASIETGGSFDPNAYNKGSGASGLFQFIPSTARLYNLDPFDPVASVDAAAKLAYNNKRYLEDALGRDPSDAELYLAHQQGASGAAELLKNPGALASDVVGLQAVIQNGGTAAMSAGDFASLWTSKFDQTLPLDTAGAPSAIGGLEGWFLRGTVIIMGFIFVGVGLAMFRDPNKSVVNVVSDTAAKVASKAKGTAPPVGVVP